MDKRQKGEDLADFVRRVRKEKRLSLRDVETMSGGKISKGYVGHVENRHVLPESLTAQKLAALAQGLGVKEEEVFAVARGLKPRSEADIHDDQELIALFYRYKELPNGKKRNVKAILDFLDQELSKLEKDKS